MVAQSVGLVLGSEIAPERLQSMVVEAESAGFGEVWLSEDCFFSGGISGPPSLLVQPNASPSASAWFQP